MREILFRGKKIDNKEWVQGDYLAPAFEKTPWILPTGEGEEVKVNPETVGQYTGLTDKNGNKIFEGDIVEYEHTLTGYYQLEIREDYKPRRSHSCYWNEDKSKLHYKRNYAVEWKEKEARFILRNGSDQHDLKRIGLIMHNGKVIGNIHDNPELMKGGVE